ncbi:MAG: hypothetical protein J5821_01210 [Alphaproteobacteria bacterium]|nr:hypothetical protein [Alphaproteobacteria bacterium]
MHSKFVRNLSYLILIISLAMIGCLIFKDLNWVLGDDELFLRTTMIGKPSHAWTGRGGFWPLGLCDYSILLLLPQAIGQTIEAHFAYNIIIMSISVFILYHFFNKIDEKNYGLSLFFILILFCVSSFLQIHNSCIYPERMMFFMQVLFMYFWLKGYQNRSMMFYLLSWIFCTYLIFSKEPIFGAVLVIALTNLIFGWNQLTEKDRSFHFLQIFSALTYLGIYIYRYFYRNGGESLYNGGNFAFSQGVDALNTVKAIFVGEPLLGLIFLFALVRAYFVFVKSDRRTLFIDSLLFGAAAYAIAYIILSFTSSYYVFPSLVFAFPSLVFWTDYLWKENKFASILIVLLCGGAAYLSFNISKDFAQNAYKLRNNDMKVVDFIADSYMKGKYVFFFMDGEPLSRFNTSMNGKNVWEFNVYSHFTNYVLKKKNYLRDKNILRPLEKLEYIFDDSIVMCPVNMEQKYKKYLNSRGFRVLRSAYNIDVYGQ